MQVQTIWIDLNKKKVHRGGFEDVDHFFAPTAREIFPLDSLFFNRVEVSN